MHVTKIEYDEVNKIFIAWVNDLHPDTPEDHPHSFSAIAIANRMVTYGLSTEVEAIDAILKEIDDHLNGTQRDPTWANDANVAKTEIIQPHLDLITEHVERFMAETVPVEE